MELPHFHSYQASTVLRRPRGRSLPAWALGLYFPLLLVYLEIILHLAAGSAMTYFPFTYSSPCQPAACWPCCPSCSLGKPDAS